MPSHSGADSQFESGTIKPSIDHISKLATAFSCSVACIDESLLALPGFANKPKHHDILALKNSICNTITGKILESTVMNNDAKVEAMNIIRNAISLLNIEEFIFFSSNPLDINTPNSTEENGDTQD